MKKILIATLTVQLAASSQAAEVSFPDADGSHDIGSAAAWTGADPQTGDTVTFAGGVTYKLTADKSLPGPMKVTGAGKTAFDFSADKKTLTVAGGLEDAAPNGRETVLKGGTWSVTGGLYKYLYGDGSTLLFDGVTMTAASLPYFRNVSTLAKNSSCVLSNGTKVTLSSVSSLFDGSGSNWSTNNVLLVTGGAEVDIGAREFHIGGSYGDFDENRVYDNRLIVRGVGSKVYTAGGNGASIAVGYQCGNNTVIVEDGGYVRSYNFRVGQVNGGVAASRNTVIIRNGGIYTNTQESAVGAGSGSHSNRVFVLSGGQLNVGKTGTYAQLHVGNGNSSYNTVVLSNGTITARWMDVGCGVESHDNRFDIQGTGSTFFNTDGDAWHLFGMGHDNLVAVGPQADFTFRSSIDFGDASNASYGSRNAIEVDGQSSFTVKGLTMGATTRESSGNRISIGAGSALTIAESQHSYIYSDNSELVVSNGTLNVGKTAAGCWLCIGSSDRTKAHPGTNSWLVLRGATPLVTAKDYCFLGLYGSNGIRFELPPEGYSEAPIRNVVQLQCDDTAMIEFTGVERYQRRIDAETEVPLIQTSSDTGMNWIRNRLDAINAKLPNGCYCYVKADSGNDQLWLHVKPKRGFCIVFY